MPETITLRKLDVPNCDGTWIRISTTATGVVRAGATRIWGHPKGAKLNGADIGIYARPGVKWLGPLPTE